MLISELLRRYYTVFIRIQPDKFIVHFCFEGLIEFSTRDHSVTIKIKFERQA